jgi:hypothetical protein
MDKADEINVSTERDSCIICLSNADYTYTNTNGSCGSIENGHLKNDDHVEIEIVEKSNTPLLEIRVLCGNRAGNENSRDGICNCRYNIHTSCFVESNMVFNNVCPTCRKNWWSSETDLDPKPYEYDSSEVSPSNFVTYMNLSVCRFASNRYCAFILAMFVFILVFFMGLIVAN